MTCFAELSPNISQKIQSLDRKHPYLWMVDTEWNLLFITLYTVLAIAEHQTYLQFFKKGISQVYSKPGPEPCPGKYGLILPKILTTLAANLAFNSELGEISEHPAIGEISGHTAAVQVPENPTPRNISEPKF